MTVSRKIKWSAPRILKTSKVNKGESLTLVRERITLKKSAASRCVLIMF